MRRIWQRATALIVLSIVLALAACTAEIGDGGADIRGTVTSIHPANPEGQASGLLGSVLIEGSVEADTQFDKAAVTITGQTRIVQQQGQDRRPASFESLAVGQRVQARFTGPAAESYPVQATAAEIVILE